MKKFIKASIFVICFFCLFNFIFLYLGIPKRPIYYFYKEPRNSQDVIYIGGSNAYVHFNPLVAYRNNGFITGMISSDTQPFPLVKYMIKEARKYQKPKLYIIDIANIHYISASEGSIRLATSHMRFSKNKLDALNNVLKYSKIPKKDYLSYYFDFLTYHSSWKYINKNVVDNSELYKGFLLADVNTKMVKQEKFIWNSKSIPLSEKSKSCLINLIYYLKNNLSSDEKVLFVIPPRFYETKLMGNLNDASKIITEHNFEIINFNTLDDYEANYTLEFYNKQHLNVLGATRFTKYFSEYISQKYDLPDHRGNKKYSSWEKEYHRYTENYKEIMGKDFILK